MSSHSIAGEAPFPIDPQKQAALLSFYQTCWNEMSWRRNAGYRTVILGFAYFGILLSLVAFNSHPSGALRIALSLVLAIGTLFGAGYLTSNYRKYMAASALTVKIEAFLGAYQSDYLGTLGPLMPLQRRERPNVPLSKDPVCFLSVLAFLGGGLLTAIFILFI